MTRPTPVQAACIPAALAGRDVVGVAQTGSGKTAAFALPLLQRLARDPYGVHSLVLTPTRELAFQIGESFAALGSGPRPAQVCVVVGGLDARPQAARLAQERPHVVVATPGRLADLVETHSEVADAFARVSALVLDEADRLLDGAAGFERPLTAICSRLPRGRQSMLVSATMSSSLVEMQGAVMRDAFVFTVSILMVDEGVERERKRKRRAKKNFFSLRKTLVRVEKCFSLFSTLTTYQILINLPETKLSKNQNRLTRGCAPRTASRSSTRSSRRK